MQAAGTAHHGDSYTFARARWKGALRGRVCRAVVLSLALWPLLAWGAARALITGAHLDRADAILVLANASAYAERSQKAARLWGEGRAPRVVLTDEGLRSIWSNELQRNLIISERAADELQRAGVPRERIEVLPGTVGSTYEEAVRSLDYATRRGLRSILVVTSAYHSRRALWTFRHVFRGSGIEVGLEAGAPGGQSPGPATWWFRPSGWKTVALEYPKLIYYRLRYRALETVALSEPDPRAGTLQTVTSGNRSAGLTLTLTTPPTARVGEVVLLDARRSVGVSRVPLPDGKPPVRIDFGDGQTCELLACGHAYRRAGTYTVTLTGSDATGKTNDQVTQQIVVSDIPPATGLNTRDGAGQNVIDMTNREGNAAYYIAPAAYGDARGNAAKLQNAIKRAASNNGGAEQEIILPAGAVFAGPVVLARPAGEKYITIRTAALAALPAAGTRLDPAAHAQALPTLTSPSATNNTLAALWTPQPAPALPAHHYRLQGLRLRKASEAGHSQSLLTLGDVNPGQNRASMLPHHFIVERCWLDGGASDTSQATNGLRVAADSVSVLDSHLGEFRLIGAGVDAAAVSLSKGRGPYAFVNNTMVATSENFNAAGGYADAWEGTISGPTTTAGDPLLDVTGLEVDMNIALPVGGRYHPDQSTIVRCDRREPVTFDPIPDAPDANGSQVGCPPFFPRVPRQPPVQAPEVAQRRAGLERHRLQRQEPVGGEGRALLVVDGNVFENHWIEDQSYAITLTPRNGTGGEHPATVLRELQFSNNLIRNVATSSSSCPRTRRTGARGT